MKSWRQVPLRDSTMTQQKPGLGPGNQMGINVASRMLPALRQYMQSHSRSHGRQTLQLTVRSHKSPDDKGVPS